MATSQNGWPVHATQKDLAILSYVTGRVARGPVAEIFTHFCAWFDQHIEPIRRQASWGWAYRPIRGNTTGYSNHASGTAIDLNAPDHPMGKFNTFNAGQRERIRQQLKRYDGVLKWGGDWKNRPDDMHFEINGTPADVERVARSLAGRRTPSVSLSRLISAATADPPANHQRPSSAADVLPVEAALVSEGLLSKLWADGHFGTATVAAYSKWQQRCGYRGRDADGIPGRASLIKLGQKYGFEVRP